MTATSTFFEWYYIGFGGIGGWLVFFILALIAVIWVIYDSASRRLPAIGWRLSIIITFALILPTILYTFSGIEMKGTLGQYMEGLFYLGLLGGLLPPVLVIGYYVTFRDLVGCPQGHIYEEALGECPSCSAEQGPRPGPGESPRRPPVSDPPPEDVPLPSKTKVQAWLAAEGGHSHQLCEGETTIGRHSNNDIRLTGDSSISRHHAKIAQQGEHFKLFDLGSDNGTRVNNRLVRQPVMIEKDDKIQFGEGVPLRFIK